MNTKEWRALIRKLRQHYPITSPITVRRYPAKKNCGLITFNDSSYRIRVDSSQSTTGQIDALLHEWAHARAIEQACEHGRAWAEAYGEIYTSWLGDFTQ